MSRQFLVVFVVGLAVGFGVQQVAVASFSLAQGDWVVLTTTATRIPVTRVRR